VGFNGGVITLDPVVEVGWRSANDGPHLAPMADLPAGSWLVVDGGRTVEAAGLFVSLLAEREGLGRDAGAAEAVAAVVKADTLILPGGLRVTDTMTGKSVVPGCCAGLEAWRDWVELLERRQPWMGHDPGPWVEFRDGRVRLWQDGRSSSRVAWNLASRACGEGARLRRVRLRRVVGGESRRHCCVPARVRVEERHLPHVDDDGYDGR
jgi:hypothetical protein